MAISAGVSRPFRVLVAGGSYGGLAATVHLLDHCSGAKAALAAAAAAADAPNPSHQPMQPDTVPIEITIVDERDGFYHLIGTPLAFASESFAPKAWVKYTDIPALKGSNVHCLQGTISSISPAEKTATVIESVSKETKKLHYDYFIAATGLRRSWPSNPRSIRRKNYIFEAESQISAMASTKDHGGAVIVGGGAVGIEMAAELKLCFPDLPVTLVHSRDKLLSAEPLPDEFKDASLDIVREMGIEVRLNSRLKSSHTVKDDSVNRVNSIPATTGVELEFEDGSTMKAGEVVVAVSKAEPATNYLPVQALDDRKYIRVLPSLEFHSDTGMANASSHFAAGDTVSWSGIKRCGAAMHMGMYAANNIYRSMLENLGIAGSPDLLELQEIPPMIGIAVGKKAVSYWPGQGTVAGEEVLQQMFQDDLGFKICWNHMMLGLTH